MSLPSMSQLLLAAASSIAGLAQDDPTIQLRLDRPDYLPGEAAQVWTKAGYDGYLLVAHVLPGGSVNILFPLDPYDENYVTAGKDYEVIGRAGGPAIAMDGVPGTGWVFAALSPQPFQFGEFERQGHWNGVSLYLDPSLDVEQQLLELAGSMLYSYESFDYDILSYQLLGDEALTYQDDSRSYVTTSVQYHVYQPYPYYCCGLGYYGWYGGGLSFTVGIGWPVWPYWVDYWYRPVYWPYPVYLSGYRHAWYYPYPRYHYPRHRSWYYDRYHYRPRYTDPYRFKRGGTDRRLGSDPYRPRGSRVAIDRPSAPRPSAGYRPRGDQTGTRVGRGAPGSQSRSGRVASAAPRSSGGTAAAGRRVVPGTDGSTRARRARVPGRASETPGRRSADSPTRGGGRAASSPPRGRDRSGPSRTSGRDASQPRRQATGAENSPRARRATVPGRASETPGRGSADISARDGRRRASSPSNPRRAAAVPGERRSPDRMVAPRGSRERSRASRPSAGRSPSVSRSAPRGGSRASRPGPSRGSSRPGRTPVRRGP